MAIVNPNESGGSRTCTPGRKVLASIGLDRSETQKLSPTLEAHWVCVKDLSAPAGGNGEKGLDVWDTFVLTDAARWRLGTAARAIGWTQPFDDENDEDVLQVFTNGYVIATLEEETNPQNGKVQVRVKRYDPYTGPEGDDWAAIIQKGERGHDRYRDAARKTRKSKFVPVGIATPAASGDASTGGGDFGAEDDDLPF
jgi:hypothetical protein